MKQLAILNAEKASSEEVDSFAERSAARAVVFDPENRVALLFVAKENYYKLPGGGVEEGEDKISALKRECREEIGSDIEVINELGFIVEYRKFCDLKQTSYCYVAKLIGKKGTPVFTDDEIADDFSCVWVPFAEALGLLSKNVASNIEGREYIVPRDSVFLKAGIKAMDLD